jgi:hypothetical protein
MKRNMGKAISFCAVCLLTAAVVYAGGVSNLDVTISDAASTLAFRGKTDSNGVFTPGAVAAGNYAQSTPGMRPRIAPITRLRGSRPSPGSG